MKIENKRRCVEFPSVKDAADVAVPFDRWADLLPEMLLKIFSYLNVKDRTRVALVCRDWRAAVYVRSLWNKTVFKTEATRLTEPTTISTLADRGVRRIKLFDACQFRMSGIKYKMEQLVAAMTDIEDLDVSECPRLTANILTRAVQWSGPLVALKCLNIAGVKSTTGVVLSVIAEYYPNIEDLKCCLDDESDSLWPTALGRFSSLRRLDLTSLDFADCRGVTSERIKSLVRSVPTLEFLALSAHFVHDDAAICIAQGLPRLTSLMLTSCYHLTAAVGDALSRVGLQELCIKESNDGDMFRRLFGGDSRLANTIRTLNAYNVTDNSVRHLAASACPNLVSLVITAGDITAEGIKSVASIATLIKLSVIHCFRLNADAIGILASGQLTQLELLNLQSCGSLSDWIDTNQFASLCLCVCVAALRRVDLGHAYTMTDAGIQKLVRGSPQLEWLGLCDGDGRWVRRMRSPITLRTLGYIAAGLRNLVGIELCYVLSKYSVDTLSDNISVTRFLQLPRLRYIALEMDHVDAHRQFIAARRPDIEIISHKQAQRAFE